LKLLVTADLHIRDYSNLNSSMDGPIPERLSIYQHLANDIAGVVEKEKCDTIILAGDILDIHTNHPVVLTALRKFVDTSTRSGVPILTCHGQHDISVKVVDGYIRQMTSLSVFECDRFYYFHDSLVYFEPGNVPKIINSLDEVPKKSKGITLFFYGWTQQPCRNLKRADVFIGHHQVSAAVDMKGYTFTGGYDSQLLSETYNFSVVGDIHNSQVFFDNLLIPGVPLQNKFFDNSVCGVWVIDSDNWSRKFIEFTSPVYPKYFIVDSERDIPQDFPSNHHYRVSSKVHSEGTSKQINVDVDKISLLQITENLISGIKSEDRSLLLKLSKMLFDGIKTRSFQAKTIPCIIPKKLTINNFVSIKEAVFEFPEGVSAFVGDIGSGKSTLLESIPYALYGKYDKMEAVADVISTSFDGDPEVTFEFSVDGTNYKIRRGVSKLHLFVNSTETSDGTEKSGSKMPETQTIINKLLQMTYSEFCSVVFFSQGKHSFFKHIAEADQLSLLSLFLGSNSERIDALIIDSNKLKKDYGQRVDQHIGVIDSHKKQIETYENNLSILKVNQVSTQMRQAKILNENGFENISEDVISLMISGQTVKAANNYFNIDIEQTKERRNITIQLRSDLLQEYTEKKSQFDISTVKLNGLEEKIKSTESKIKRYKKGVCPECKQKLPIDKNYLQSLVGELKSYQAESEQLKIVLSNGNLKEINLLQTKVSGLGKKIEEMEDVLTSASQFISCKAEDFRGEKEIAKAEGIVESSREALEKEEKDLKITSKIYNAYKTLTQNVFCDNGLRSKCIEAVGVLISDYVNNLYKTIDKKYTVDISTVSYTQGGKPKKGFQVRAWFNGIRTSYSMASGGQKMLIDLASISAIYNLLSSSYALEGGIMSMMVLDEFVRYLDEENIEAVADILDSINTKSLFLVSHDLKLKQLTLQRTIEAEMKDGISYYSM
jgi:DNA repair exonuclease SbcCD ATPase subunit